MIRRTHRWLAGAAVALLSAGAIHLDAVEQAWAPVIDGQVLHANTLEFAPLSFRDVVTTPRLDGRILYFKECRATAYGGTVTGDIATNLAEGTYHCLFNLTGGDLAACLRELGGNAENLAGRVDGWIDFSLVTDHPETLTGKGHLAISKASLVQLPLLTNLLVGDPGASRGQDALVIDFELRDQQIHLMQADLRSPAAEIAITGSIGFDGQLKMVLIPNLAFKLVDQIPGIGILFTPLLSTVGSRAGRVLVRGQISKPVLVADPFGRQN